MLSPKNICNRSRSKVCGLQYIYIYIFYAFSNNFCNCCFPIVYFVDIEGHNLVLSAKYSLINSAEKLPVEISEIHPNTMVHVSDASFNVYHFM